MKKFLLMVCLFSLLANIVYAGEKLTTIWQKCAAQGSLPRWFDTNHMTRGLGYGKVAGNDRLYVVSRNGGTFIYILDAATGDSLGRLDNTGIAEGVHLVSDVGVSEDGIIFVCNLSLGTTFKVYSWANEAAAPALAIAHTHSGRLGDKMTVVGSASDNSLAIYAASGNSAQILKFTTADNGATFSADTIAINVFGGSASVGPMGPGAVDFYYNATGINPHKFSVDGTDLGTIPGAVVATGSNSIRYITATGAIEYFTTFQYGSGNENARIVKVPGGDPTLAKSYAITPQLGTNVNTNGSGDVSVMDNGDGTFTLFVLSTNNGLGAYKVEFPVPPIEPMNLVLNWELDTSTYPFFANDNNTRGIGYNSRTDHLLVAARTGGVFIYALDATTGAIVDTLDMTGIAGGVIPLMKVLADTNGVIYACNLALAASEFKVYRWADEAAAPAVAFAGVVTGRTGDAFNITGTSTSTIVYASGTGNAEIVVLTTTNGENFTAATPIPVAAGTARGGIAPITENLGTDFWINGAGTTLRHIAGNGTLIAEADGSVVGVSWMNAAFMPADNGARLVAVNANNIAGDRRKLQVWHVTDFETQPELWAAGETGNLENVNGNGSGEIICKDNGDNTFTVFQLTSNNAIASWTMTVPEYVPLMTIAAAKVDANGDFVPDLLGQTVKIKGIITTPNYSSGSQYYMQDETAGIQVFGGSSLVIDVKAGDEVMITGKIDQYRGATEIVQFMAEDVKALSTGNIVEPKLVKITDLSEDTEGLLVKLENVWIVDPTQWPAEGSNKNVDITDGVDTTYVYIDRDTDLDGWTPPTGMIDLTAICEQFTTNTPPDDGYSLRGTFREHFIEKVIMTIAEAKVDSNGDFVPDLLGETVTLKGIITTPNYSSGSQYYMQDETAGIQVYGGSSLVIDVKAGDEVIITGKIDQYRGATEIVQFTADDVRVLSTGNVVEPKVVKIADLSEDTEGLLVKLESVWIVNPTQWPAEGSNKNVDITDGVDTTYVYIDRDTDLDGWTPPTGKMDLIAICEQYTTNTPPDDGYSLRGTFREHFIELVEPAKPLFTLWEKTQAAGSFPAYFSTSNYERGMAYGKVEGNDRIYVLTRFGPHRIVIHEALTGDSVGVIPKPPQAEGVGYFHLNCVDVSDDGVIFACNMSLGSDAANPFRVYRWNNETADPVTAISYDAALGRMGDMFSVNGSASDNSLVIYAGVANSNKIVKFTTTDNGTTFTPEIFEFQTGAFGTLPNVADPGDGTIYIKSYGRRLFRYNMTTAEKDTVASEIVGTGASKIKYLGTDDKDYLIVYYPDLAGAGSAEKITLVDVTNGPQKAKVVAYSPSIGSVTNGNGTGSADFWQVSDTSFVFFILGTNNGVAAFTNDQDFVLASLDTLFYGNTATLLANPYGWGYIAGTNEYGDVGKYQRFDFKPGDELYGFRYYFAHKEIVNTPDTLKLVVKTVSGIGGPDSTIAMLTTTTDALDTTMVGNHFLLMRPIKVTGPVFIGFEWASTNDDRFAIYTDTDGEGDGADRAWEQFSDGKYNDFGRVLEPDYSWGIDVDLWIAAYYKKVTITSAEDASSNTLPTGYALQQNYPNPFNPTTTISLAIPENANVKVVVFNIRGQIVAELFDGKLRAGQHEFHFDAKHLSSGIYFYRVKANNFTAVKKMMLLK